MSFPSITGSRLDKSFKISRKLPGFVLSETSLCPLKPIFCLAQMRSTFKYGFKIMAIVGYDLDSHGIHSLSYGSVVFRLELVL